MEKTAIQTAKDVMEKVKAAKRRWDLHDPLREKKLQPTMEEAQVPPRMCDVIIVGGGIMGSSIAYHLTKEHLGCEMGVDVLVVEKDPTVSIV